jgi:hypothetical protein
MQNPSERTDQAEPRSEFPRLTLRGAAFAALIVLLPLTLIGVMTFFTVAAVTDQYDALSFRPVDAEIISSESASKPGQGAKYDLSIEYRYAVEGKTYTADTFRLGAMPTDSFWVTEQIRAFPAGSERTAYVDPDDPARAVLDNSFTLRDMFLPAVLSVFYAVIATVFVGAVHVLRILIGGPLTLAGAQLIRVDHETTRIRPHHLPPSFRAAGSAVLLLFGALLLLFFVVIHFEDRFIVFPATLGGIAMIVVVQWVFLVWPWRRASREITIDRRERVVVGPVSRDQPDRAEIPIAQIAAVTTDRRGTGVVARLSPSSSARGKTVELVRFNPGKTGLASDFANDFAELLSVPSAAPD